MTPVVLLDTETTGIRTTDEVIELAYIHLPYLEELRQTNPIYAGDFHVHCERFYPSCEIHPEAEKVHGISKSLLIGCPPSESIKLPEHTYMLGFNISFDHKMLRFPTTQLICVLAIARKLWKKGSGVGEVSGHKLTTLVREIVPEGESLIAEAHSALSDCYLTFILLDEALKLLPRITSWEELYQYQLPEGKPVLKPKVPRSPMKAMPFGKHKGEEFSEIPTDYLKWVLKQDITDALRTAIEDWV